MKFQEGDIVCIRSSPHNPIGKVVSYNSFGLISVDMYVEAFKGTTMLLPATLLAKYEWEDKVAWEV